MIGADAPLRRRPCSPALAGLAVEGRAVTKNQARAAIAATSTGALHARVHRSELPLHRLRGVAAE